MALAVWLQKNLKNFRGLLGSNGEDGVYACMSLGAFLVVVSILGMVGVCKRRTPAGRCMLYTFVITMLLVVALEAATAAMMFTSAGAC